jgi:salicylate hydroxylase
MGPKIAIIGGGIGGLTAAVALARKGLAAEVYEQAPALEEVGAGVGPVAERVDGAGASGTRCGMRRQEHAMPADSLAGQRLLAAAASR